MLVLSMGLVIAPGDTVEAAALPRSVCIGLSLFDESLRKTKYPVKRTIIKTLDIIIIGTLAFLIKFFPS